MIIKNAKCLAIRNESHAALLYFETYRFRLKKFSVAKSLVVLTSNYMHTPEIIIDSFKVRILRTKNFLLSNKSHFVKQLYENSF